jgi:hypothetical protein
MFELDNLLEQIKGIEKYQQNLSFPENDVRRDFHGLILDIVQNYYWNNCAYEFYFQMGEKNIGFAAKEGVGSLTPHINRLADIPKKNQRSYLNNMYRSLILGTWTSFELAVSTIVDAIVSGQEKERLQSRRADKIIDLFPDGNKPGDGVIKKIKKELKEGYIHIIPMPDRINSILNMYPDKYTGDINKDKEFINFYSKIRSSLIHNNGIYYGGDFSYDFYAYKFIFKKGEKFSYKRMEDHAEIDIYMTLAYELIKIFMRISDLTSDVQFIPYPDTNLED